MDDASRPRRAFRRDAQANRALSAAKAAWWTAASAAGKAMIRRAGEAEAPAPPARVSAAPPPPKGYLRRLWLEAFRKDAADIAAGLYPLTERPPANLVQSFQRAWDLLQDGLQIHERRGRRAGLEVREEAAPDSYPGYYRQNFHYQTGGWFTPDSARRYESQVEALFNGAAGAMRRRALSLLARAWRERDQRALVFADVACGSGAFLDDLRASFPRAQVFGADLSPTYVAEAQSRTGMPVVQANAERLPFADASLDGVTCVYLFHELPPRVRRLVAAEIARVLKPGGVLAFADSVQGSDVPELARALELFPAFFHEPYYESYQQEDVVALFAGAGLIVKERDQAFLTKALLLERQS